MNSKFPLMSFDVENSSKNECVGLYESEKGVKCQGIKKWPLSYSQREIWSLRQRNSEACGMFSLNWELKIKRKFKPVEVQWSVNNVIRQHENLRTAFTPINESCDLVVADNLRIDIPIIQVNEQDLDQYIDNNALGAFDIVNGPLLRVYILELSKEESRVLISMHRMISDEAFIGVFNRSLMSICEAISSGNGRELLPLRSQYVDFARRERDWLQGEWLECQVDYWKEQLAGAPVLLELPTDRPRPASRSYRGGRFGFHISAELTERVSLLARNTGTSLFATLLSGFSVLLSRYCRQEDICIGIPVENRQGKELAGLIECFNNTLALRIRLGGNPEFMELLECVKAGTRAAYKNQDVPFWHLVEILKAEISESYAPLVQVLFSLESSVEDIGGENFLSLMDSRVSTTGYDLVVNLEQKGKCISGVIDYSLDLFDEGTAERIVEHFQVLLRGIVERPEERVYELPLMSEMERDKILYEWNQTERNYPEGFCVHELFDIQVEKTPHAVAVIIDERQLTYEELNNQSNQLAHYLIDLGVKPDTSVGILVERSFELAIGVIGILKAGGSYVPLDPNYPKNRLLYMLEQIDIKILLTQSGINVNFPRQLHTVLLDTRLWWLSDSISIIDCPKTETAPENIAYVIFTSGSTGHPKAVAMPHSALSNLIQWQLENSECSAGSNTLQFSSFSFDVSFQELFSTWCNGGKLIMIDEEQRKDPVVLWNVLVRQKINRLFIPFFALQLLAEGYQDAVEQIPDGRLSRTSIQEIVTAGEQLKITPAIRTLFQKTPDCRLYNHYGPSETHVCTALDLGSSPKTWENIPTIGKPIANECVCILDPYLNPVPVGVYGEMYIGGKGLAQGYLDRDDLTKARFIENPFKRAKNVSNERLYKTGDLAKYRTDGTIEYKGRKDDQVKIRGYRIELAEIENILIAQPEVKEAIVGVHSRGKTFQDKYLIAYVVFENGVTKNMLQHKKILRKVIQQHLPEYMHPNAYQFLDALPLTPSGKVDRKALAFLTNNISFNKEYVDPFTKTEGILANIWANAFDIAADEIDTKTNFMELGGDSLIAIRIVRKIRKKFDVVIKIKDIFDAESIQSLALMIDKFQYSRENFPINDNKFIPKTRVNRIQPIPLSFAQQGLWFLHQLEGGVDTLYNEHLALELKGNLDTAALCKAVKIIVQRHEILRTTYSIANGEVTQIVSDNFILNIPIIEIANMCVSSEIKNYICNLFDLEKGPLIKVIIFHLSHNEHILLLNFHHIICDGSSLKVFAVELNSFYLMYKKRDLPLYIKLQQTRPLQYADYSFWQRQWVKNDVLDKQIRYWKKQLEGIPDLLELPSDRPRPAIPSSAGRRHHFCVSAELTEKLRQFSKDVETTMFITLLAGLNILLHRYSGLHDICVGAPIDNRQQPELENSIGLYVNTLVLRSHFNGQGSVNKFFKSFKKTAFEAYSYQELPFDLLVKELKPKRSRSYSPLFQVAFNLQVSLEQSFILPDINVSAVEVDTETSKFDLTVNLTEKKDEITGFIEYKTDIYNNPTIDSFCSHYCLLLESITKFPQQNLFDLPILTAEEKQKILYDWNDTTENYPPGKCIHQLFEEQALANPDIIAVSFGNHYLTYDELDRKSNQLAHYLIENSIETEVRVGVYLERSLEMITAMLGILKAGCAYVPIDTVYPLQRIKHIINCSHISILLTQKKLIHKIPSIEKIIYLYFKKNMSDLIDKPTTSPGMKVSPHNIVYIIYTSGSTGKPKGVIVSHYSLYQLCKWHQKTFSITNRSCASQLASVAFDAMAWEVWPYLTIGAHLFLSPPNMVLRPEDLIAWLNANNITHCFSPTPIVETLLAQDWEKTISLKVLLTGGDKLKKLPPDNLPFTLVNNYGPTECTIVATSGIVSGKEPLTPNIGRPISNTKTYILDNNLNIVPIPVKGELYIGGASLARGYLDRPDLTAERFIPDSLSGKPGARLYKTGDIVRYDANGYINYFGRNDSQVKVRGMRIELGEIENILRQLSGIYEAIVVAHSPMKETRNFCLVAYLVTKKGKQLYRKILIDQLKESLPEYMIPRFFVFLENIPLTHNGKIDRESLPKPNSDDLQFIDYTKPTTKTEKQLAIIWSEILSISKDKIGQHNSFFELGGHSLLAHRVVGRIEEKFNIKIKMRDLFDKGSVQSIALMIDENIDSLYLI